MRASPLHTFCLLAAATLTSAARHGDVDIAEHDAGSLGGQALGDSLGTSRTGRQPRPGYERSVEEGGFCFNGKMANRPGEVFGRNCRPPHFEIDMRQPPEARWVEVAKTRVFQDHLAGLVATFRAIGLFSEDLRAKASELCAPLLVDDDAGKDYCGELRGYVTQFQDLELEVGDLVLVNTLYELESMCTSVLAAGPDGTVLHARTLDFQFATQLKRLTFTALLDYGGGLQVNITQFFGYVGVLTGIRPGAFGISINQRFSESSPHGEVKAQKVMEMLDLKLAYRRGRAAPAAAAERGGLPVGILAREVLESAPDYAVARDMLASTPLLAGVYFALSGSRPYQGATLTRSPQALDDEQQLSPMHPVLALTNSDPEPGYPVVPPRRFAWTIAIKAGRCNTCLKSDAIKRSIARRIGVNRGEVTAECDGIGGLILRRNVTLESCDDARVATAGGDISDIVRKMLYQMEHGKPGSSHGAHLDVRLQAPEMISFEEETGARCSTPVDDVRVKASFEPPLPKKHELPGSRQELCAVAEFTYDYRGGGHEDPWESLLPVVVDTAEYGGVSEGTVYGTLMEPRAAPTTLPAPMMAVIEWSWEYDRI